VLSLIVPVYRNEGSLPELLDVVESIHEKIEDGLEAVFVIDGSPDRSYELLSEALPRRPFRSRLALLSRNFGSFAAIRAGLERGDGERFAVMAADLQEPPELVLRMDEVLRNDGADVVLGVREGRADPLSSRLPAQAFWTAYRRLIIPEMPPGGVDVFACTRAFRDQLLRLDERHSSLVAQLFWLGYRRSFVGYVRAERAHGKSAWTFRKKLGYLSDSVFSFTDLPIKLLTWIGGLFAIILGIYGLAVAGLRLIGWIDVPGFTMLIVLVAFLGALNIFALGLVGSYAWRAYENTKARPNHVVQREHRFGPGARSRDIAAAASAGARGRFLASQLPA
jgi:glycosyltransferase involved in cell wall biosynthesis